MGLPILLPTGAFQTQLQNVNDLGGATLADNTVGGSAAWTFPNGIVGYTTTSTSEKSLLDFASGAGQGVEGTDGPAFVAAFAWLNAAPNRALYIPPAPFGLYYYNQTVRGTLSVTQTNAVVYGAGRATVIDFIGTTGDGIHLTNDYQTLWNLELFSSQQFAGYSLVNTTGGNDVKLRNLFIKQYSAGNGVTASHSVATLYWSIQDVSIVLSQTTNIGLDLSQTTCSLIWGNGFTIEGGGMATGNTNVGIKFPTTVSQDTVVFANFLVNNFNIGLSFQVSTGGNASDYFFSNAVVDQCYKGAYYLTGSTGVINRHVYSQVWFGAGGAASVGLEFATGTAAIYNVSFNQCRFYGSSSGVQFDAAGPALQAIEFVGCVFEISGYGLYIGSDSEIDVVGCTFQSNTTYAIVFNATFTAANFKQITNCSFKGNANNLFFSAATNAYGGLIAIRNCIGINPQGLVAGPPAVPASTVAQANPYPFDTIVQIVAGASTVSFTVSGVNGTTPSTTIPVAGTATIQLPVGASWTPTYTNAPTTTWMGL